MYHNYKRYYEYSSYPVRITKPNSYFLDFGKGIKNSYIVPINEYMMSDQCTNYIYDAGNAFLRLL